MCIRNIKFCGRFHKTHTHIYISVLWIFTLNLRSCMFYVMESKINLISNQNFPFGFTLSPLQWTMETLYSQKKKIVEYTSRFYFSFFFVCESIFPWWMWKSSHYRKLIIYYHLLGFRYGNHNSNTLCRMMSPQKPINNTVYVDLLAKFIVNMWLCENRLTCSKWERWLIENLHDLNYPQTSEKNISLLNPKIYVIYVSH